MLKHILRLFGAVVLLLVSGCVSRYDVELTAPDLSLDTINPSIPVLAAALPINPGSNTFRVQWRIVPDPRLPLETLPHSFIYDRTAQTLAYHHSMPYYDLYTGVTDSILQQVAARKAGVRWLLKLGCKRSFPKE